MKMGADHIATGHYAQVREVDGRFELLRGIDPGKDQSYFLHRLNQAQLSKAVFPVGGMYKRDVRKLAAELGPHVTVQLFSGLKKTGVEELTTNLLSWIDPEGRFA